jgi:hypothetical protein
MTLRWPQRHISWLRLLFMRALRQAGAVCERLFLGTGDLLPITEPVENGVSGVLTSSHLLDRLKVEHQAF